MIYASTEVMRKYDVIPITITNIQSQAEGGLQQWTLEMYESH